MTSAGCACSIEGILIPWLNANMLQETVAALVSSMGSYRTGPCSFKAVLVMRYRMLRYGFVPYCITRLHCCHHESYVSMDGCPCVHEAFQLCVWTAHLWSMRQYWWQADVRSLYVSE